MNQEARNCVMMEICATVYNFLLQRVSQFIKRLLESTQLLIQLPLLTLMMASAVQPWQVCYSPDTSSYELVPLKERMLFPKKYLYSNLLTPRKTVTFLIICSITTGGLWTFHVNIFCHFYKLLTGMSDSTQILIASNTMAHS